MKPPHQQVQFNVYHMIIVQLCIDTSLSLALIGIDEKREIKVKDSTNITWWPTSLIVCTVFGRKIWCRNLATNITSLSHQPFYQFSNTCQLEQKKVRHKGYHGMENLFHIWNRHLFIYPWFLSEFCSLLQQIVMTMARMRRATTPPTTPMARLRSTWGTWWSLYCGVCITIMMIILMPLAWWRRADNPPTTLIWRLRSIDEICSELF